MKKLYINVDRCEIIGGVDKLTTIVKNVDRRLQEFCQETEEIKGILFKFVSNNTSDQYKKASLAVKNLSIKLYDSSVAINDMQKQIVKYQQNIARFNDSRASFCNPNNHMVKKVNVDVNLAKTQFTYADMMIVFKCLNKYILDGTNTVKQLQNDKLSIGSIWRDPQYRDFSEFIDSVTKIIVDAIKLLTEYTNHLGIRIKELKN